MIKNNKLSTCLFNVLLMYQQEHCLLDIYFEETFNRKEKNPSAISLKELHLNLCASLLMADFLMLLGLDAVSHPVMCTMVAFALHFLFLSVFGWILAEGARTYDQVNNVCWPMTPLVTHSSFYNFLFVPFQNTRTFPFSQKWFYYLLGDGFAFLIVLITFFSDQEGYGTTEL